MLSGFHHVHVKGPDPRKTAQWYVDVFDARILDDYERGGAPFLILDLGGVFLNVSGAENSEQLGPGSADKHFGLGHFGVATDDLDAVAERLALHDVEILHAPPRGANGAGAIFIKAPDDVRIEIYRPPD